MEAGLTRLEGWESRLAEVIEAARHHPYVLGSHDCLRMACDCTKAITGRDFWPRFEGYKTKREALRKILQIAPTLSEAVSLILEQVPGRPKSARRGDVVLYRDTEDHLGVCIGASVSLLAPDGLHFLPLTHPGLIDCWRIG